ncbi:MAG: zeta toxin family protein [Melioribacteraceae bacterium]|nr:zeta toxin family protein [Melioribacteraceae bacterium]
MKQISITDEINSRINKITKRPAFIIITGRGGCGKTTLAQLLVKSIAGSSVLHLDDYRYSRTSRASSGLLGSNPSANKIELLLNHLKVLKQNIEVEKPVYDPVTGSDESSEKFRPAQFIFLEGELGLHREILKLADYSIAIKANFFNQMFARIFRDASRRKYGLCKTLKVFYQSNITDFNKYYRKNLYKINMVIESDLKGGYKIIGESN